MGENSRITSGLRFIGYEVNEVIFNRNKELPDNIDSWDTDFNIGNVVNMSKDNKRMSIDLDVEIFRNTINPPFTMKVSIVGYFETIGDEEIEKYKANAIAIMYPYLRAIVSAYTSVSNVNSLILPAINVNALLKEQETKK